MTGEVRDDEIKLEESSKTYHELLAENYMLRRKVKHALRFSLALLVVAIFSVGAVIAIIINFISLDTRNCDRD